MNFTNRLLACAALLLLGASVGQVRAQAPTPVSAPPEAASPLKVVKIKLGSGRVAGLSDGVVASWKAIPYAAPPVGPLRWRPPQKAEAWRGVRPAGKVGAICEQDYNSADNGVGPLPKSEDCLTLNIWAPAAAKRAPVMVWIHGGGFINGSGTAALYDGDALARQGVVVVTLNYRLGRFGFFAHPALSEGPRPEMSGNYGLMDIIAALGWVRDNIARVGGDPGHVTIFGESAGGVAVNDLMVSPLARGLFTRAIVESGLGREGAYGFAQAQEAGRAVTAKAGLLNPTAEQLRALPAEAILKWGALDLMKGEGPMIDGALLPMRPADAFAKGLEAPLPYVVGWNNLEAPFPPALAELMMSASPRFSADLKTRLQQAYPSPQAYADNVASDLLFVEPGRNLAKLHARNGHPTFAYQFSVLPTAATGLKGTPHAAERQYVFNTLGASPWPTDANDAAQARTVSAFWTDFAKAKPSFGLDWPAYSEAEQLLEFTNAGPQVVVAPRLEALKILESLQP
ncbi:carboxylesterase/lipase family protein [Caulobacter rhizosphaerae]|uniref:carboxylesterase/lipase family protein n=1 Tax=Caulobacter rhizosphaerae TaxID=2010972 RepID=UPI0013D5B1FD|nr:carboxylesterase family protein [Caulobacter rhizosphaerae]GGL35139.1 carboxylic ester hydrolase [Caulobacter rhizosphaerae]